MGTQENIATVEKMYDAFGRGDVAALLDALADQVDWAAEAESEAAPWYGSRRGKEAVAKFFEAFGSTMEVEEFTPRSIAGNATDVFSVVRCRAKSRKTGKSVDMNLHHFFHFENGKVAYYRGSEDTAQVLAALE